METSHRYALRKSLWLFCGGILIAASPFGLKFIPHKDAEAFLVLAVSIWIVAFLVGMAGLITLIASVWLRLRPPRFK